MTKLFVYGTLKQFGRPHSPLLNFGIITSPPEVCVVHDYTLFKGFAPFPMARPAPNLNRVIQGELVTIEQDVERALERLDRYEGVASGLYTRETVSAYLARGSVEQAFMYVATPEAIARARAVEIGSFFSRDVVTF